MLQHPSITQIGSVHDALTEGLSEKGGRLAWAISAAQFYARGRTPKSVGYRAPSRSSRRGRTLRLAMEIEA